MRKNIVEIYDSFYFIGIGGVSMSGLAKYLISIGKKVGGSDISESEFIVELRELGAEISIDCQSDFIEEYDIIIYTDAISDCDLRLKKARDLSKHIISRGQFLYEISRAFIKVIAVSGCHGKTTCCAMLGHIFAAANQKFSLHIGGKDLKLSNFYYYGNEYFITEACEYKRNFLLLKPDISVILNSDADHLECYGSENALVEAYKKFGESSTVSVSLYGEFFDLYGITFGFDKNSDYYAKNIVDNCGCYIFDVYESGVKAGRTALNIPGKHNVLNALAAIAVARVVGISFESIFDGLRSFIGVERRFEKIGRYKGAICFADYAHHPNELRATIRAAKKMTKGNIYIIFQPHTYSRTKLLFKQFVRVLAPQNNLLIYKTFAAREYYDDAGSALTLSQSIKRARYGDDEKDIISFLSGVSGNDIVLFLGAGNIYYIAKQLMAS